jgi:hypothetical protein
MAMDLLTACRDPNLFQPWFAKTPTTWSSWFTFLKAMFALPLEGEELATFTRCTGRAVPPEKPASEAWLICGRRSGKSFMLSLIAVYLATFKDWREHLTPGEVATIMIVATDRRQARVILRYITAFLEECRLLAPLVQRKGGASEGWAIELEGRVTIEVHSCSFRAVRGYTVVAALLDEIAFWRSDDSANPDREVIEAIRPALVTTPGSILLAASSPYARKGALWEAHRKHFAKDGPVLIWQTATTMMNPTVGEAVVEAALERDPSIGASEWLALFRSDIESFITREAVESCIEPGVRERPPVRGVRYAAFCDPSGGRSDAMTLAIGHREQDCGVVDCLREARPPFDPASVVREFAETLGAYGVREIRADRYGGEWPTAEFRKHGIWCRPAEKPKSDLYRELLPGINARRVELLDDSKLVAQLVGLERRVGRGGRDSIDHPPGMHDDLANSVAGVWDSVMGKAAHNTLVQKRLLGV